MAALADLGDPKAVGLGCRGFSVFCLGLGVSAFVGLGLRGFSIFVCLR